jgi:hypothetical protein
MILVATPARDTVNATFTYDLMQLEGDFKFAISLGTYIPNNRIALVNQAIESKSTHILFIDSDMRFPKDTIARLLAHKKDVIGANCRQRTQDEWTARKGGKFVGSGKGIEEVDTLGFGVTLIDMNVFTGKLRKMPEPWFQMPYHTQDKKLVGEDVYFCTVAKEAGFKIWIDHDLSQEVRHTGSVEM